MLNQSPKPLARALVTYMPGRTQVTVQNFEGTKMFGQVMGASSVARYLERLGQQITFVTIIYHTQREF